MCEGVEALELGYGYGSGSPAVHGVLEDITPTLATFFLVNDELASQKQVPGLHSFCLAQRWSKYLVVGWASGRVGRLMGDPRQSNRTNELFKGQMEDNR